MKFLRNVVIAVCVSFCSYSQDAPLTKDAIIQMGKAGLPEDVIVSKIRSEANPPAATVPTATGPADADDPMSPHDPGIYLMTTMQDGKRKMVFIDRVGAGREKSHRGFVRASMKAEIPGPRAAVRTTANPVFYMYFPPSSNIGDERSISSPTQFSLLSLEDKKDHRETAVAKVGIFGGISIGNDAKKTSLKGYVPMRTKLLRQLA